MKKADPIAIGIGIVTVIIIGGIIIAAAVSQGGPIPQYKTGDTSRPKLSIDQTQFDFGTMKLEDIKTQEVKITNTGAKPLVLSDFITSCNCTFAQVVIQGQASPRFSMHRNPEWRGKIAPQETAVIKLIYEPQIMPVKGSVKRTIVFKTNDPGQPLVKLSFDAKVE